MNAVRSYVAKAWSLVAMIGVVVLAQSWGTDVAWWQSVTLGALVGTIMTFARWQWIASGSRRPVHVVVTLEPVGDLSGRVISALREKGVEL